jgi:choline dehydrogenase-like flavoprotein
MSWDYIIVGAGSAGCALAWQLSQGARESKILVIEAGGSDRSPYIKVPLGQIRAITRYDWGYRSQPDPSRGGASDAWLRGKVLGGSSSINGMLYVKGAASDFDRWAELCGGGWSSKEVLPIFRELECSDQSGPARGRDGRMYVRTVRKPHPITDAFIQAAAIGGYRFNEDYNGQGQEGVGYAQLSQRRGLRCSAADAFLKPLLSRNKVTLFTDSMVERIEIANGRATGVVFTREGNRCRESAREIILCAGAIGSPQILMLSGVGDPQELARHDIPVALSLPGVGRNLREHPLLRMMYRTTIPTYNVTEGMLQQLKFAANYLWYRAGPLANPFEAIAFLRSSPARVHPDIQLHFLPLGFLTHPDGSVELATVPSVTVLLNKSHPVSRGRIRLAGAKATDAPLIECRLLEEDADLDTLVQGISTVRKIMAAKPIARWIDEEVSPGRDLDEPSALEDYIRRHTTIAAHPVGTCRMGKDEEAVVDPELRVRGAQNLWVADASVMPDLISGNTNAVCMMIGAKLGKRLAAGSA